MGDAGAAWWGGVWGTLHPQHSAGLSGALQSCLWSCCRFPAWLGTSCAEALPIDNP